MNSMPSLAIGNDSPFFPKGITEARPIFPVGRPGVPSISNSHEAADPHRSAGSH